jgi:hypothetical protein
MEKIRKCLPRNVPLPGWLLHQIQTTQVSVSQRISGFYRKQSHRLAMAWFCSGEEDKSPVVSKLPSVMRKNKIYNDEYYFPTTPPASAA